LKFEKFGWNGFSFEVPKNVRFTREGGNVGNGHIFLESENCVIEAKWEPFDPKKAKPLSQVAEGLVEQMRKQSKKQKQIVEVLRKEDAHVYKHKAFYLVVKSPSEERVYIWYCSESKRIVVWRFVFASFDEDSKKTMKRVLDTLRCHGEEADVWSLLSFRFEIPSTFLLTDTKITVGRAHFMLTDRELSSFAEKTESILIEYFSMANLIFEDTYDDPDIWLEEKYLKDLGKRFKERKMKFQTAESRRFRTHKMEIKQATAASGISSRKTALYTNATWYCPRTNRIYSVTASSSIRRPVVFKRESDREAHESLMEDLLSSFRCH